MALLIELNETYSRDTYQTLNHQQKQFYNKDRFEEQWSFQAIRDLKKYFTWRNIYYTTKKKLGCTGEYIIEFCLEIIKHFKIFFSISISNEHKITPKLFLGREHSLSFIRSKKLLLAVVKIASFINKFLSAYHPFFVIDPLNGKIHIKIKTNTNLIYGSDLASYVINVLIYQSENVLRIFMKLILYTCNCISSQSVTEVNKVLFSGEDSEIVVLTKIKQLFPFLNLKLQEPNQFQPQQNQTATNYLININNNMHRFENMERPSILFDKVTLNSERIDIINKNYQCQNLSYKYFQKQLAFEGYIRRDNQFKNFNTFNITKQTEKNIIKQTKRSQIKQIDCHFNFTISQNNEQHQTFQNLPAQRFVHSYTNKIYNDCLIAKIPRKDNLARNAGSIYWQKEILSLLKSSNCIYLPKYYHSIQSHCDFKNWLYVDYLRGLTLHQKMIIHSGTISFQSKLEIGNHIASCLKFLKEKQIAHLDLSPNNIICPYETSIIKLIDFGQSYNQQVHEKSKHWQNMYKYSPGRTFPFCPPQTTTRESQFNSNQDIYSLGIILFDMFFGYYPLSCSQSIMYKVFHMGNYHQRIFFVPEAAEYAGRLDNMMILGALIIRMLDPDQNKRPFPIWIQIILKKLQWINRR